MLARTGIVLFAVNLALATSGAPLAAQASGRQGRKPVTEPAPRQTTRPVSSDLGGGEATGGAYLTGEAKFTVRGGENPVVRIGLAPSGVTVVEFPAGDEFFAVHPPENGDWVQVEKSPSLKTDHHLVLRAGKDLASRAGPAASISVQMRSGLLVTLWVYPVELITRQTHRCVISYDRTEVVAARRRAGLAVDLGGPGENGPPRVTAEAAEVGNAPAPPSPPAGGKADHSAAERVAIVSPPAFAEEKPEQETPAGKVTLKEAKELLARAAGEPKQFKSWTGPMHGLSVSTRSLDLDGGRRAALVAVRNVTGEPLHVLPEHPAISIETLDEKGRVVQITAIEKLLGESTASGGLIPARATAYYALVYATPTLGARQRLRVAVGQTRAADEPAATILAANKQ
jgi:hypothetical protein